MGAKSRALWTLRVIPLIILLVVFVAWFSYVSWSLHLFIAARPHLQVNCSEMDDPHHLADYLKNRTVIHERENSTERMTAAKCWGIKKRWYFPGEVPDTMEVHHPVYYIRIVSQDYAFFEEIFNMFYSPIHFYCYPIAETASESFERKVRFLGDCMLNVIVPPGKFDTSNVTDIFRAHSSCFHRMSGFDWRHMFVSQESQVPLQSVHFYSDVMRRIGGVSKIGHEILTEENTIALGDPSNLEHEEAKVSLLRDVCNWLHGKKEILALSRAAAQVFYPLVMNSTLDDCLQPSQLEGKCPTGHFDEDNNCIWGMENIKQARRSKSFFIHADPSFDLGFIQCVHDFVHDRTYNTAFYPNVKYGSH